MTASVNIGSLKSMIPRSPVLGTFTVLFRQS